MAAANSEAQSLGSAYISCIVREFSPPPPPPPPHTSYLGTKKCPIFTKSLTCGGLKKDSFSAKYVRWVRPPSEPECPPPPGKYSRDRPYGIHSIPIQVFGLLSYQTIKCFGTFITKSSSNVSADVFQSIKHFSALMLGLGHCMTTFRKYSII